MIRQNRHILKLRMGLPFPFFCILICFSIMIAWGHASNLRPGDSMGALLLNTFGGCVWTEEADVHEIISWMILFLPSGISVSIILSSRLSGYLSMEGYRFRKTLRWYTSLTAHIILTVLIIALIQIAFVFLFAVCYGYTGWNVWVEDIDGFTTLNTLQPCLAPLLFLLYDELIILISTVVYYISRQMTWYYIALLCPSACGVMAYSNPSVDNLWNPIHFGMAHRLSVEGGYGVQPLVACLGLMALTVVTIILGSIYCCTLSVYDRKTE